MSDLTPAQRDACALLMLQEMCAGTPARPRFGWSIHRRADDYLVLIPSALPGTDFRGTGSTLADAICAALRNAGLLRD